jgi:hypothetical protein
LSLKKQAKTFRELFHSTIVPWDTEFVTVEVAQQLQDDTISKNNDKINKILDSFPVYAFVDFKNKKVIKIPELKEWLSELHEALK